MSDCTEQTDGALDENCELSDSFIYYGPPASENGSIFLSSADEETNSDGDGYVANGADNNAYGEERGAVEGTTQLSTVATANYSLRDRGGTLLLYSSSWGGSILRDPSLEASISDARESIQALIDSVGRSHRTAEAADALERLCETCMYSHKLQAIVQALENGDNMCNDKLEKQEELIKTLRSGNKTLTTALFKTIGGITAVVIYSTCFAFAGGLLIGGRSPGTNVAVPAVLSFVLGMFASKLC
ncbi:hypothetical protein CoHVHLJ_079 [Columbid alphaherpesvirus 1]|uniref:Transmembrane protein n=1 Tax=Columbid alphaherpesvirus 1 TaxID=93386 RepID=A0A1V0M8K0_9ALPH|nr:hypothetical protein CoHVHLJ_079 [Columbid alphaherpesvirus 1]ARD71390.1 hypothetical protein CoHVHLJ_079 [Columbid alphaherpesvirus 1]